MSSISDAESQIMQALWGRHPLSAEDILAALPAQDGWQLGTVKTLLNRLLNKGAVKAEREGRRYLYEPLIERAQWEGKESLGLVDRVFGGRLSPLVAHFSAHRKLSPEDAEALRQLLKEHDDEH
ncbi:BlaI/MecI/CopY family transcriptional regulator [Pelomonas sp. APW6]|uniref:BlaI/MecI/CopY family transcriptional regulator n=1 Tax=Roseateles subflavus TaxID=3053353 RepID=A0ABT7LJM8_9BURK|nr:BlaI/MecI/CopY family transcriptional regulator [Pelomonas sp. APW6]MDL5033067.1 BlaI/MecI/CopY family transcriptional regulator [Pelomonas sp. APW6]